MLAALVLGLRPVLADSPGLVAAGAGGLVLAAAGAVPGLDAVLRAVVVHVPGGGLLRDGQKLLAPAALVVALAAGHAVGRLARAPRTAPWAVLLAVLPVLALPGLAWGVGGRLAAADYPADWLGLRAAVAQAPPGEVAALPWGTYRRLDWAGDRVVLDPLPRLLDRRTLADDALPLSGVTVRGEDPRAARVSAGLAAGERLPERAAGGRRPVRGGAPDPARLGRDRARARRAAGAVQQPGPAAGRAARPDRADARRTGPGWPWSASARPFSAWAR